MDDSHVMVGGQGLGDLAAELDDLNGRQTAAEAGDALSQRLALEELHHDIRSATI